MSEIRGIPLHGVVIDEAFGDVDKLVPEFSERAHVEAYLNMMGCKVDFQSGEIRTLDDDTLKAYLEKWARDRDILTLHVRLVTQLDYIPISVTIGGVQG